MPTSTGKALLKELKENIKEGIRYRTIYGKSKNWTRYKNMYRGFWQPGVVPVNIMFSIARSIIPQVYFRNPRVSVFPKKPGMGMHALMVETIDNYLIKETGLKDQLKSSVLDCFFCGRGPGIIGYDSEYGFNPNFTMTGVDDDSGLSSFNKKGEKIEYNQSVSPGMPWFLRCSPSDFVVAWGTKSWRESPWFAFRRMRTLRDMKEDPKMKNTSSLKAPYQSKLEGSTSGAPENTQGYKHKGLGDTNTGEKKDSGWVEVWEYHDVRTQRVFTLSLDHPQFLRDEIDYLQVESLPAEVLGFNEDPDHFWWVPDARLIRVQQEELNDIRTMASKHRRVALLKVLYDKGMNRDELSKLLDKDVKAAVGIDPGASGDIRKSVALLQSHVPPDFSIASREVRDDIREIVGFSRNMQGSFEAPGGRRTAHEAEIVRSAAMMRLNERRDILTDHLEHIVRKYNQIIFSNWSVRRVIDIVGPDGAKYWIRFSGKELKGEYNYKINPEESIPQDARVSRNEIMEFMNMAKEVPGINMQYLMRTFASKFDWLDPKLLMPGEGGGRSPERPMEFNDFMGQQMTKFPQMI